MLQLVFNCFLLVVVILQMISGVAFVGFTKDGLLHRSKHPGPFWFLMLLEFAMNVLLALFYLNPPGR